MCDAWKENGPIVVGGLGGSGTRVVAEIMATLGYYIGPDLNSASDNLWFTFLFKRPDWFKNQREDRQSIVMGLRLFEKIMLRSALPTYKEFNYLFWAFKSMANHGFSHRHAGIGKKKWALRRLLKMLTCSPANNCSYFGWGWKEPNSHLFIDDLATKFRHFKYIHTVRHGLDMAFSNNQEQFLLWGKFFGVNVPESKEHFPSAAYRFWVNANRHAVARGQALGDGRFLLVNFDRLCADPHKEIENIVQFLGMNPPSGVLAAAKNLIRPQRTTGRFREHGVEQFEHEDLDALQEFGFSL